MKLAQVLIRDKVPALSTTSLIATEDLELSFDSGLVRVVRPKFAGEEPWLIPVSNVVFMREATKPKK